MDNEVLVAIALYYHTKEAQLDGNKFCLTNVTTAGFPTFVELYYLPMTIKNDSDAPVCGGINPKTNW